MVFTWTDYTELVIGTMVTMSVASFKNWYLSKNSQTAELVIVGLGWAANHSLRKYYLITSTKKIA
jgi:hypothetical protein